MEEGEKKLYTDPETGEQVSKKELKRREKKRKKDKEEGEKKPGKEPKEPKEPTQKEQKKKPGEEELDPTKYFENRKTFLLKEIESGKNPFPHKFEVTIGLPEFIQKYKDITKKGEFLDEVVQVAGRVHSIRKSGASLIFYDIRSNGAKIQIFVNKKNHKGAKSFEETHNPIRRGDFIGVIGNPGRTNPKDKEGELSVSATDVIQLSYCLHMLPKEESGLKETETRFRQRYLDLLMNPEIKRNFVIRNKISVYIIDQFVNFPLNFNIFLFSLNLLFLSIISYGFVNRIFQKFPKIFFLFLNYFKLFVSKDVSKSLFIFARNLRFWFCG